MPQDRLPSTRSAGPESPAPASPALPPEPLTPDGKDRRVGVEIEYAGVPVAEVAGLVQRIFGGTVVVEDGHRRIIRDTDLGDFTVELDWRLAHGAPALAPPLALPLDRVPDALRERVGDVGSLVMPFEIVCPPIPLARIGELDRLVDHLRRRGGKGTEARFFYAFGLHFNVEVGRRDVTALLHLLRAYLLLSPWLRDQLGVALARRVAPFVHRFPDGYADLVLAPGYAPDLTGLILDYISWNPSRNRELDLYPLF
ncbi:MAG: hypothetical protein RLY86_1684, partial [Pseudomonadota bacterium]